jgi:hypothetical protein
MEGIVKLLVCVAVAFVFVDCESMEDQVSDNEVRVDGRVATSQKMIRSAELVQKYCCESIKSNELGEAVSYFRQSLSNEADSPSGMVFDIVVSGLCKARYLLKQPVFRDYGLSNKSRKAINSVSDAQLKEVFSVIHAFSKIHPSFSKKDIDDYFDDYFKQSDMECNS